MSHGKDTNCILVCNVYGTENDDIISLEFSFPLAFPIFAIQKIHLDMIHASHLRRQLFIIHQHSHLPEKLGMNHPFLLRIPPRHKLRRRQHAPIPQPSEPPCAILVVKIYNPSVVHTIHDQLRDILRPTLRMWKQGTQSRVR